MRFFNKEALLALRQTSKEAIKRLKDRDKANGTNFVENKLPKLRLLFRLNNKQDFGPE